MLSAAAPTAAVAPDVTVRVGDSTLADGGSVTVTDDPEVGVEVAAESAIDSVSIRVDGDPVRTFSPDSDSFSETVTLDVTDGDHELTVVASADGTTTLGGTVTKDSAAPRVRSHGRLEATGSPTASTIRASPSPDRCSSGPGRTRCGSD